jgi:hypothetical protein
MSLLFNEMKHVLAVPPLEKALRKNDIKKIQQLITKGTELNESGNPSFLIAARYCDEKILRFLAERGANIHAKNNVGSDAFSEAVIGEKAENLFAIHLLGHTVKKHGGQAFRMAVAHQYYPIIEFFIDHEVDINYNKSDMVYPYHPTALCVAAYQRDLDMVKFLVERGADVLLAESNGMRPYSIAMENGDWEMTEFLKTCEPPELHSKQAAVERFQKYQLPQALLEFLSNDQLRLTMCDTCAIPFVTFFSLEDVVEFTLNRRKYLRLSKETGEQSHICFVWNPKTKQIACHDQEHDELKDIGTFSDFIAAPELHIQRIWD